MVENEIPDDLELVAEVCLGKPQAFEQIVRKYQTKIRGFCRQMLADEALAEEAAQEVFIKSWQSIKGFRPNPSFSSWIFRIARNHCVDLIRRRQAANTTSLNELAEKSGGESAALSDGRSSQASAEDRDLLAKLLHSLPKHHCEVILLREMYGMSYEEIAEVLECTVDSVKGRLKRARTEITYNLRHFSESSNVVSKEDDYECLSRRR